MEVTNGHGGAKRKDTYFLVIISSTATAIQINPPPLTWIISSLFPSFLLQQMLFYRLRMVSLLGSVSRHPEW